MRHGFSLVELSIVLVILGLLTGGILAGQSLIRASELRAVTAEFQRYHAAANTFRDKYFAVPGDFRDATKFWNRLNTNADCVSNSGLATAGSPGACDGNGNGQLSNPGAAGASGEALQFWRQLALAGLIEGTYSGITGSTALEYTIGTNVPRSKVSSGGWSAGYWNNSAGGNASYYALDFGHHLWVGADTVETPAGPLLRPEEAWNIDTKMDDGKPAQGKIIAVYWNNYCAAADDGTHADNDFVASYKLSDSAVRCALDFRQLF